MCITFTSVAQILILFDPKPTDITPRTTSGSAYDNCMAVILVILG